MPVRSRFFWCSIWAQSGRLRQTASPPTRFQRQNAKVQISKYAELKMEKLESPKFTLPQYSIPRKYKVFRAFPVFPCINFTTDVPFLINFTMYLDCSADTS